MTSSLNPHLSQTLDDRIRGGLLIQGNIPEAWPGSYDDATQQEEMNTASRIPLLASELRHNNSKKFSAVGPEAKSKHRHRAQLGYGKQVRREKTCREKKRGLENHGTNEGHRKWLTHTNARALARKITHSCSNS